VAGEPAFALAVSDPPLGALSGALAKAYIIEAAERAGAVGDPEFAVSRVTTTRGGLGRCAARLQKLRADLRGALVQSKRQRDARSTRWKHLDECYGRWNALARSGSASCAA
jgi:hypothetical protein